GVPRSLLQHAEVFLIGLGAGVLHGLGLLLADVAYVPRLVLVAGGFFLAHRVAHDQPVVDRVLGDPLAGRRLSEGLLQLGAAVGIAQIGGQAQLVLAGPRAGRDPLRVVGAVLRLVLVEQGGLAL